MVEIVSFVVVTMGKLFDMHEMVEGGVLHCIQAGTVGMPFEVWKTHMGINIKETTFESFRNIYKKNGLKSFWSGELTLS